MFKPANTVTKAVGGKYTSLLRQAEQHLLVKQAELQNAQRDVVEGEGYLQVLSAFIQQQEKLHPIMQQHIAWAEHLTAADAQAAVASVMPSAAPLLLYQQHQEQQAVHTQQHMLASHSSACQPQQLASSAFNDTEAVRSGSLPQRPLVPGGTDYALRLLETATPQDVQQALLMTPDSMIQWYMQVFKALVTLIELARRSAYDVAAAPDSSFDVSQLGTACGRGSSSATGGADAMHTAAPDTHHQQQVCSASPEGSLAGAAALQPRAAADEASVSALRATCTAARRQLEHYMDRFVLMSTLTQFHNPLVVWTLAASNLVTREATAAPPQHWLMVARRTALTQQQLRQLRLVMQVFERQCRSTASQGECVLQNMASLSISRVLEDINDIRSSGGCSMDGGSSGSGRVSSSGSGNSSGPAERAEHSNNHGSGIAAAATQAAAAASSGPASSLATSPSAAAAAAAGVAASESTQTCTQPAVTAPASSSLEDEANANDGAAQIALIDSRLQRYMRLRNIQACAGNFLIVGHIDKLQMAELLVASFPFYPIPGAMVEAAAVEERHQQMRVQQQQQQQDQQPRQRQRRRKATNTE